jgi:hypothetical protein
LKIIVNLSAKYIRSFIFILPKNFLFCFVFIFIKIITCFNSNTLFFQKKIVILFVLYFFFLFNFKLCFVILVP